MFLNTNQALHTGKGWNASAQEPTSHVIDDDFPYFFGVKVKPADIYEKFEQDYGFDYNGDQVFDSSHFLPIVSALQEGVQSGQGAVHRSELVTVENKRWGILAGTKVNVTWVYLARAWQFEDLLSDELRVMVQPSGEDHASPDTDYGNAIDGGMFDRFPNYATEEAIMPPERLVFIIYIFTTILKC